MANVKSVTTGNTSVKPKSYRTFGSMSNTFKKHEYRGVKNKTDFPEFIELCKATQKELKVTLPTRLVDAGYNDVVVGDGYIYAKGDIPYLVTAHMDTVHEETVKDFYEYIDEKGNHIISSPQGIGGDDRCGIYMILEIIKEFKPYVLFCEDEEIGGIGSSKFCETDLFTELYDLNYMIELDRANAKDAVFYECDNPDFTKFITENTGYRESWGSFSDISTLAPDSRVAAVNLSCGYYHAHTLEEEVNVEEMLNTIEVVKKLLRTECEQFEYVEAVYNYGGGYGKYSSYYGSYYHSNLYGRYNWYDDDNESCVIVYVTYYDSKTGEEKHARSTGETEIRAMYNFLTKDHPEVCFYDILDFEYDYTMS